MTASLVIAAGRIALMIALDTAALIVWDIGTRSPRQLLSDLRRGFGHRIAIVRFCVRFTFGALALVAAVMVSEQTTRHPADATVAVCWALTTALVLEQLVGPALRAGKDR